MLRNGRSSVHLVTRCPGRRPLCDQMDAARQPTHRLPSQKPGRPANKARPKGRRRQPTAKSDPPYWYRSASAGYTRDARRAGAYVVASAIAYTAAKMISNAAHGGENVRLLQLGDWLASLRKL